MVATTTHKLKLDAVPDASNCLVLRLQGGTAPLPSTYLFYTGTCSLVEVTVLFPVPFGSLYFAGTTYADSDGNKIITVQCAAPNDLEIEALLPSPATAPSKTEEAGAAELPSVVRKPRAPSTRVRLMPKIGYPPSGGDNT